MLGYIHHKTFHPHKTIDFQVVTHINPTITRYFCATKKKSYITTAHGKICYIISMPNTSTMGLYSESYTRILFNKSNRKYK